MSLIRTSRYISMILRHKPEKIGITLDEHSQAKIDELIEGVNQTHPLNFSILEEIVKTDNKQRYSFKKDKTLIRVNQGHSILVDVELETKTPPQYLYHGTGEKYVTSIEQRGIISKSRLYVHLSNEIETVVEVGSRHGNPIVYRVNSRKMADDGFEFYLSVNNVWLTTVVPLEYLEKLNVE